MAKPAPGQDPAVLTPRVEAWLRRADRTDFPWKVRLLPPRLTYQQRHLVEVQAVIRSEDLQTVDHVQELFFTLAVGDEKGRWLREAEPTTLEIPANFGKLQEIVFSEGIYLRPGSYVIGVLAGYSADQKVNVLRLSVRVPPLKSDPLSGTKISLPVVEFAPDLPPNPPGVLQIARRVWPMAPEPLPLPVENSRPVAIDLVLNTAFSFAIASGRGSATSAVSWYPLLAGAVLQTGNFLSQMELKSGCIRTSVVDVLRMQVIADRQEPRRLNWDQLQTPLWRTGSHTVDVGSLQNRNRQSAFLHDVLDGIMSDSDFCSDGKGKATHIVALISQDLQFPPETVMMRMQPRADENCRIYYFQFEVGVTFGGNTIHSMIKTLRPRVLRFQSPNAFRQAAARFLADILK